MTRGRALARNRWLAVANAEFNRETLLWLANVAASIVKADDNKDDNKRSAAVLRAVGLFGRNDPERLTIRNIVRDVDHTCALIEQGSKLRRGRALERGEQNRCRRNAVADLLGLDETPAAIDKRIARALAN